ncbi:hypothetical protein ABH966_001235 [Lysinibacillus sp. RC46]|uniref:hypothetical protein n=1 Tax=Lysinibacillus sp. RC46 TaxID=3156295 RepID=UPI003519219D
MERAKRVKRLIGRPTGSFALCESVATATTKRPAGTEINSLFAVSNTLFKLTPYIDIKQNKEAPLSSTDSDASFSQRGWEKCSRSNKGVYVCFCDLFHMNQFIME